jgi:predicted nucleotidyltransferase
MYILQPAFPSSFHEQATNAIVEHFRGRPFVKAILLTNSCARGKATKDSCVDMTIVHDPAITSQAYEEMQRSLQEYIAKEPVFERLKKVGKYSEMEVDFTNAHMDVSTYKRGATTGPDQFELAVGNPFVYSVILWEADSYFRDLRNSWLPYYGEGLRRQRLAMAISYFENNVDHITPYATRGLHIECIKRIYHAFEEFLQILFISRKIYPIAYDKHIHEQIAEILGEEELYTHLAALFEIEKLNADNLIEKSRQLTNLMETYITEDA